MELKPLFDQIVDAIHSRDGQKDGIAASDFPARIRAIPAGGGVEVSSLAITVPPDKTQYQAGEAFDPAGMTLTATLSNGYTVSPNPEDLSFEPDGPLASETASVTVRFAWGNGSASVEQPVSVEGAVYGVSWDGTSTTKWTRLHDAARFEDPVAYRPGGTDYGSPFDEIYPWAGMTVSERAGGTMVSVPKFWYRLTPHTADKGFDVDISSAPVTGFSVSPMHMDRGDGKGERDVAYIGRYHCSAGYRSVSGVKPLGQTTIRAAWAGIEQNLDETYWMMDYASLFTIWLLYLVEYADWDSQQCIGYGGGSGSLANMGYTDSMPYHTGTTSKKTTADFGTQYRYLEGLWDNVYDMMTGGYITKSLQIGLQTDPQKFATIQTDHVIVGTGGSGYPSEFAVKDGAGFQVFMPTRISGGSSSTYTCDQWYLEGQSSYIVHGGSYDPYQNIGMFALNYVPETFSDTAVGTRTMELP